MKFKTDNDLAIGLANGQVEAFNTLYWKYHAVVYANVIKLIKNPAGAEDIVQDVFIALWNKRQSLDPLKSIAGWLFTVSYNKAIDHLKLQLRESLAFQTLSTSNSSLSEVNADVEDLHLQILNKAILQLSPQKRKVFELCKLKGKTYDEAARELHISKHTVKEYLSLAVENIRRHIKKSPDYLTAFVDMVICMALFS